MELLARSLRSEDPATGHFSASSFFFICIQAKVEIVPNLQVVQECDSVVN